MHDVLRKWFRTKANDCYSLFFRLEFEAKLFQKAELIFEAEDTENSITNAEAGVEAALTTKLSLVLTVKNEYNNQPAEGKERNDFSLITSLKVSL